MRVTRLEIFGFKSFVERFSLAFDENLIGIVGPNGCGKSNIVDSLRWVLGETHARQLRGTKQEDLIFNGSDSRRPLGMAEVSITIRPSEHWGEQARQQQDELAALLRDDEPEGGTDESSLQEEPLVVEESLEIETGAIDIVTGDSISDGAQEGDSSTAASLATKEQSSNGHAAESILRSRLTEIPGLFNASEIQLTRRLYRSGESEYFINRVPCRLRDMTEIYRLIGLGARGLNIVQQGQIGQIISKKPIERRELIEDAAGISGFRTKLEAAQRKLDRTADNMARLKDIIIEVEKQVRVLKRQANRARTRNELKEKLESAELGLFAVKSAKILIGKNKAALEQDGLTTELESHRSSQAKLDAEHGELRAQLEKLDIDLVALRSKRDEFFAKLNSERDRLQKLEKDLVRCDTELAEVDVREDELVQREDELDQELLRCEQERNDLQQQQSVLQEELQQAEQLVASVREAVAEELASIESEMTEKVRSLESAASTVSVEEIERQILMLSGQLESLDGVEVDQRALRMKLRERKEALQQRLVKKAAIESESRSLHEQQEAVAEHVGKAMGDAATQLSENEVLRTLSSAMVVPSDMQAAVQAALGDKGNFVVSDTAIELGKRFASTTRSGDGRVGVIQRRPKGIADAVALSASEQQAVPTARFLAEAVEVQDDYSDLLRALLVDVVVVPDFQSALSFQEAGLAENVYRRMIVTEAGEVVTPWGWYTNDSSGVGYSFARRIEELSVAQEEILSEIESIEQEVATLEAEEQSLANEAARAKGIQGQITEARKQLSDALQEERRVAQAQQREIRAEEGRRREQALVREREAQAEVNRINSEVQKLGSQIQFSLRSTERLESEKEKVAESRVALQQRVEEVRATKERIGSELNVSGADSGRDELETALGVVDREVRELEEERNKHNLRVAEAAQELSEGRRELEKVSDRHSKAALAIERSDLELSMLLEDVSRYYGDACQFPSQQEIEVLLEETGGSLDSRVEELQEQSNTLRRRLEREGEVDPESIGRFDEESTRLETLQTQYDDLASATKTLERTIRRLKDLSKTRFVATFEDVRKKFQELVPRLFGGGAGHMELVDPDDPLGSGVHISVRPPGKRLGSMELLSGGEKALVATAVQIAMFLHRPSPVCVLDEVDAPLDDANLDRFISLIQEIADRTQFLVITHNKATMAAMNRLLGITMQERGVSTALSVTFSEAEEELEQWVANA